MIASMMNPDYSERPTLQDLLDLPIMRSVRRRRYVALCFRKMVSQDLGSIGLSWPRVGVSHSIYHIQRYLFMFQIICVSVSYKIMIYIKTENTNATRKQQEQCTVSEMEAIPGKRLLDLGMPYRTKQTTDTKDKYINNHTCMDSLLDPSSSFVSSRTPFL